MFILPICRISSGSRLALRRCREFLFSVSDSVVVFISIWLGSQDGSLREHLSPRLAEEEDITNFAGIDSDK